MALLRTTWLQRKHIGLYPEDNPADMINLATLTATYTFGTTRSIMQFPTLDELAQALLASQTLIISLGSLPGTLHHMHLI